MPGVKFILDAEAGKAVQEFLRLRNAEKGADDGMRELAASSAAASRTMSEGARAAARDYELAGNAARRSNVAPIRTADSQAYRARSFRGSAVYDVAPIVSSSLRGPGAPIAVAGDNGEYLLKGGTEDAEASMGRANALLAKGRGRLTAWREDNLAHEELQREMALESMRGRVRNQRAQQEKYEGRMIAGFTAAGVAIAAFTGLVDEASQKLEARASAGVAFETDVRGLLSLGDNYKHGDQIRRDVMAASGAYGLSTSQVAGAQFMLNSAASNLGTKAQGEIFSAGIGLNQVAGGDLQAELVAVTKLMQTYGKELGSADMAASKLLATEDKAAVTLEELANLLPDVLPAAKLMGHTYDDVAASVITATQVLGNNDKTLTGLRNTFLRLGQAQQEGLIHQGTFIEQIEELSQVPSPQLEKIFGERTVAIVAALADHVGELKDHMKEMGAVAASDTFQKFLNLQAGSRANADILAGYTASAGTDNARVYEGNPDLQRHAVLLAAAKRGFKISALAHPTLDALTPDKYYGIASAMAAQSAMSVTEPPDDYDPNLDKVEAGLAAFVDDKMSMAAKGDKQALFQANRMRLQFGAFLGSSVDGKYTGDEEAAEYTDLSKWLGGSIGLGDYGQYRSDELKGDKNAMNADLAVMKKAIADAAAANLEAARLHKEAAEQQKKAADTQKAAANTAVKNKDPNRNTE